MKSIPNQVELLIGLHVILSPDYRLLPDLSSWRIYDRVAKENICLDLVHRIVNRRCLGPFNLLSVCAGMCIEVAVMLELGFEVAFVDVVETSPVTRVIAAASFPMVRFSKSGDVNDNINLIKLADSLLGLLVLDAFIGLVFVTIQVDTVSLDLQRSLQVLYG